MEEVWKDIIGYEGLYQVSNIGRVKSVSHYKWINKNNGHYRYCPESIITPINTKNGKYFYVNLYKDKKLKGMRINRLVLTAFDREPYKDEVGMHLDNNGLNNNITNLKWGTSIENNRQRDKEGRRANTSGINNPMANHNEKQIEEIKKLSKYKKLKISEIANQTGKSYHFIYGIVTERKWKSIKV